MFRHLIAAVLVLSCLSVPVRAQDNACNTPALVQLADYVLASRTEAFSRFETRNYGSTALYLKIIYGDMPEEAATEAVVDLFKANARDSDQLASAFLLSHYGYKKAAEMLGPGFAPKFFDTTSNISLARAFMLSEERNVFLDGLANLETPLFQSHASTDAVVALLDQSDDIKLQFAKEAEALGLDLMAAGFLLSRSNLDEWRAFARRQPGIENWPGLISQWWALPPLNGRNILQTSENRKNTGTMGASQLSKILDAEYRLSESPILSRVINYTGKMGEAARAVDEFHALKADRTPGARGRVDLARLDMFSGLFFASEDPQFLTADLTLVTSILGRPFRLNFRDELDWLLATSVTQYLTAEKDNLPPVREVPLSREFSKTWPLWLEAIRLTKSDAPIDLNSLEPLQIAIAAELLFVNQMDSKLLSLFAGALPDPLLVKLAKDFAIRLDRTCQNFLKRTGSNIYLMSVPMYKFDKPSK